MALPDEMRRIYEQTGSAAKTAEAMGVTAVTVRLYRARDWQPCPGRRPIYRYDAETIANAHWVYQETQSYRATARRTGIHEMVLRQIARRGWCVARDAEKGLSPAEDEMLRAMAKERITVAQIARRLGRTRPSIYQRLARLGIRRRKVFGIPRADIVRSPRAGASTCARLAHRPLSQCAGAGPR